MVKRGNLLELKILPAVAHGEESEIILQVKEGAFYKSKSNICWHLHMVLNTRGILPGVYLINAFIWHPAYNVHCIKHCILKSVAYPSKWNITPQKNSNMHTKHKPDSTNPHPVKTIIHPHTKSCPYKLRLVSAATSQTFHSQTTVPIRGFPSFG